MTKEQAIHLMSQGQKVTHKHFSSNEWCTMQNNRVLTEDGYDTDPIIWWSYRHDSTFDTDWSIYKPQQIETMEIPILIPEKDHSICDTAETVFQLMSQGHKTIQISTENFDEDDMEFIADVYAWDKFDFTYTTTSTFITLNIT